MSLGLWDLFGGAKLFQVTELLPPPGSVLGLDVSVKVDSFNRVPALARPGLLSNP